MPNLPSCVCGACTLCRKRERQRRWRQSRPEEAREYSRAASAKWRARNPERARELKRANQRAPEQAEKRRARHAARRAWLQDMKRVPCADCGQQFHPAAMDFHHTDGKDFAIGQSMTVAKHRVLAEIARCVVLCAVCHRLRHVNEESP